MHTSVPKAFKVDDDDDMFIGIFVVTRMRLHSFMYGTDFGNSEVCVLAT